MVDGKEDLQDLVLISSTENTAFAKKIANYLGKPLAETERTSFRDSDFKVRIAESESVRGKHACLIMTFHPPISERFQELVIWIDALMSGSLKGLTIVLPFFFGSRQDRKTRRGEPINLRAYLNAMRGVAYDQVSKLGWMTVDLHAPQLQALSMTFDNLSALPLFARHIKKNYNNIAIVAPDTGGLKTAEKFSEILGVSSPTCIPKTRSEDGSVNDHWCSGLGVAGKTAVLIDDMIDSGGTLVLACDTLRRAGAKEIVVCATHLLLNPPAEENLRKIGAKIIGTDTIYHSPEKINDLGVTTLPISYVFGEAIKRQHLGVSTKELHTEEAVDICFNEGLQVHLK